MINFKSLHFNFFYTQHTFIEFKFFQLKMFSRTGLKKNCIFNLNFALFWDSNVFSAKFEIEN